MPIRLTFTRSPWGPALLLLALLAAPAAHADYDDDPWLVLGGFGDSKQAIRAEDFDLGADFTDAVFVKGRDLKKAPFHQRHKEHLRRAVLDHTDCTRANFSYLDLTTTRTEGTNLTDAILEGAEILEQDVEHYRQQGANLDGVVLVKQQPADPDGDAVMAEAAPPAAPASSSSLASSSSAGQGQKRKAEEGEPEARPAKRRHTGGQANVAGWQVNFEAYRTYRANLAAGKPWRKDWPMSAHPSRWLHTQRTKMANAKPGDKVAKDRLAQLKTLPEWQKGPAKRKVALTWQQSYDIAASLPSSRVPVAAVHKGEPIGRWLRDERTLHRGDPASYPADKKKMEALPDWSWEKYKRPARPSLPDAAPAAR